MHAHAEVSLIAETVHTRFVETALPLGSVYCYFENFAWEFLIHGDPFRCMSMDLPLPLSLHIPVLPGENADNTM
jgi:hypothetical protein